MLLTLFASCCLTVSSISAVPASRPAPDLRAAVDAALAVAQTRPADNLQGGLAWGVSYELAALVLMLEHTGEARYAEPFVRLADHVLAVRDDRVGRKDEVRNAILPAWGSTKYTKGKPYVWAVHTGMLAEPLARFAAVVRTRTELARFEEAAGRYLKAAQESVAVHDSQFREGPAAGEGYLVEPFSGLEAPLNMQNALARAWLAIDDATGEPAHRERIERLARFFKNRLRLMNDAYLWEYRPPLDGAGVGFEDISHAAINVDFACQCYRHNIVFTREDIKRFARTLLTRVLFPGGKVANNVGGAGGVDKYVTAALHWSVLGAEEPRVCENLIGFVDDPRLFRGSSLAAGLARLYASCRGPATRPVQ